MNTLGCSIIIHSNALDQIDENNIPVNEETSSDSDLQVFGVYICAVLHNL